MKIKNNAPRIIGLGTDAQLRPGENTIEAGVWQKWEKDTDVLRMLDEGTLEIAGSKRGGKRSKKAEEAPAPTEPEQPEQPEGDDSEPTEEELAAMLGGGEKSEDKQ